VLSIVCPVYNEAENIARLLDKIATEVSVPREIIIVFDNDTDSTLPVVRDISSRYTFEIKLVKNGFGAGALNALKTGFAAAQGEAVLVVMADLSDDFSVVDEMYRLITTRSFDIVCGSRYMRGGRQVGGPRLKKLFSRAIGLSLHWLTGLPSHDVTNSFKMYRRRLFEETQIESRGGFEIGMELLVKAFVNGRKITEVPSTWRDRTAGKSRFRLWQWAPGYFRWYLYVLRRPWRQKKNRV
jgi:dolichol-phosphate mannosyltransferase